jgi:hypothetical protein
MKFCVKKKENTFFFFSIFLRYLNFYKKETFVNISGCFLAALLHPAALQQKKKKFFI